jgi:NADP-dependent 3-hydroxy acid dehydrogenase YdfG
MANQYAGKSRVVAIAGASGGAGKHVTEALLAAGLKVILLLRKVLRTRSLSIIAVDRRLHRKTSIL